MHSGRHKMDLLFVGIVTVMILLPIADNLGGFTSNIRLNERRSPARFDAALAPELKIRDRIEALREATNDRFGGRSLMIRAEADLYLSLFNQSHDDRVLVGRQGYMFKKETLRHHHGLHRLTPEQMTLVAQFFVDGKKVCEGLGAIHIVLVTPSKVTIHDEELPPAWRQQSARTSTDDFVEYMKTKTEVTILDLRGFLKDLSQDRPTYFKTDSHWTPEAAFLVANKVAKYLEAALPGFVAKPKSAFKSKSREFPVGDLLCLMGTSKELRETVDVPYSSNYESLYFKDAVGGPYDFAYHTFATLHVSGGEADRPRALVMRDSMGIALMPYLAEQFSESTYFWPRDIPDAVHRFAGLLREGPQVVIHQFSEKDLDVFFYNLK